MNSFVLGSGEGRFLVFDLKAPNGCHHVIIAVIEECRKIEVCLGTD